MSYESIYVAVAISPDSMYVVVAISPDSMYVVVTISPIYVYVCTIMCTYFTVFAWSCVRAVGNVYSLIMVIDVKG